ncbi:MAG: sulfurtransferase complex subunit TusB [Cycloclasticus sp.]|nr:sulfurtransferase complex subunit TusB [Cycloclasticus sp.]
MLYVVNKNCTDSYALQSCVERARDGDVILLIENAVYAGISSPETSVLQGVADGVDVYTLTPDMQARGLDPSQCFDFVRFVDYAGFVELVVSNKPIRSRF